jgi:hypothetical protein
MAKKFEKPATH